MAKVCPVCHRHAAVIDTTFGVLPCQDCQLKRLGNSLPNHQVEFTTADIKDQRKKYAKDIIQPWRGGELSAEYVEAYGTKGIDIAPEVAKKKAKRVWRDQNFYNE